MTRPLLLDLYCGAGGAAMGYHQAGFDVAGVDINPQPNYPFEFHQADALTYLTHHGWTFDAIHASPPCQFELITPTQALLQCTGLPYVIENVPRARKWMQDPITLCGKTFGLDLYRHRLFESNTSLMQPPHLEHTIPASKAGHWKPGTIMSISGHIAPIAEARRAMGIDWMTRDELAESIPPAFTEYVGAQLLDAIEAAA